VTISLWQVLRRSLLHRRARSLSALVALTVSAAVATALLTLYADLDAKLHHTFRGFGANIVVTASTLPANALTTAQQAAGPDANLAQFAYAVATTDRGTPVVVAGVDFPAVQKLDSWWSVTTWPTGPNDALLGTRAAEFIGNEKSVTLTFAGKSATFQGAGQVKTGGDEDSRVYIPLSAFEAWTSVQPSVLEVQIPGGAAKVDAAIIRLKAALPGADVEPVRQLVEGESKIVDRTHALMFGAVMKALGGTERQMTALFLGETLLLALGGVLLGWAVGSFAAWAISELNFGTASLPRIGVVPLVLALNIVIAGLAAFLPLRSLRGLEPAALLKGE
jgi:putative ABC transport system permease protein